MSKLTFLNTALLTCLCIFSAHGQIAIDNTSELPRLKKSTTYIVMPDTASAVAQPYKAIFQQYWTCTPIAFIEYKDIYEHLSPEASFFSLGAYSQTNTFVSVNDKGVRREGSSYTNTHLYYEQGLGETRRGCSGGVIRNHKMKIINFLHKPTLLYSIVTNAIKHISQ